jgi:hypothetical protein
MHAHVLEKKERMHAFTYLQLILVIPGLERFPLVSQTSP